MKLHLNSLSFSNGPLIIDANQYAACVLSYEFPFRRFDAGYAKKMTDAEAEPLLGCRVLVAEDDSIIALDMELLLRDAGAEVFGPVKTTAAAVALAKTAPLSCAVLDVNLGSDLVFPVAHFLRERDIKTIFCTGYSDPESLSKDWPDAQVLVKPVQSHHLIRAVKRAHQHVRKRNAS